MIHLVGPLARAFGWAPPAVTGATTVLMVAAVDAGSPLSAGMALTLLRMGGVLLAAAAGFGLVDEMDAGTAAAPVPRWARQWLRCAFADLAAALGWTAALLVAVARLPAGQELRVPGMAVEAAVCVAVGLLAVAVAGRFHQGRAAALAGTGALVAFVSVTLALRGTYWPWLYPQEAAWDAVHYGWLAALPLVLAGLAWANRDLR
ncbi:hypothetical protein Ssi03_03840 [Sphaerisporangium siamense]|nr:hypothetical protein Ssi03_03840 [Sphaerisporangium siamense]